MLAIGLECHPDPILLVSDLNDLRVQHDLREECLDALLQHGYEIAIGAGQQSSRHFDNGHLAAERRVHGAELEADVAAANDEQRFRDVGDLQSRG